MPWNYLRKINGNALVGVMMAGVIFSISSLTFIKAIQKLGFAERGIATNLDFSNSVIALDLIFQTPEACEKSGLIGVQLDPLNPTTTPIQLLSPGGSVYMKEGGSVNQTRKVEQLRFTSMTSVGAPTYLATLSFATSTIGEALTLRKNAKDFLLKLVLDNSNRIVQCSSRNPVSVGPECRTVSSGWSPWPVNEARNATCPTGFTGVSCLAEFYDNNGSSYHGAQKGNWDPSRTICSTTNADTGITEGQVSADCCPLADSSSGQQTFSGRVSVGFNNGQGHSNFATVNFPFPCQNPIIVTQSVADSIACSDISNPQALGYCSSGTGTTSQDLKSYYLNVTSASFQVLLSGESGVCTGISGSNPIGTPCAATSPLYPVNYIVTCGS